MVGAVGTYRSALSSRAFGLTMLHFALASTAIGILAMLVAVEVFQRSGSTGWATAALLAHVLPFVIFSPLGGVIGDRYDRVRVVRISGAAVAGAALLLVAFITSAPLTLLVAINFVVFVLWTPFYPSTISLVPTTIDSQNLVPAVGLLTTTESISWFVGPGLGGLLLTIGGPRLTALVACGIAAAGVAVGGSWRRAVDATATPVTIGTDADEPSIARMLSEGFRTVVSSKTIVGPLVVLITVEVVYGATQVVLLVAATTLFGLGEGGFGGLTAALSVGACVALLIVNRLARVERQLLTIGLAVLIAGLPAALAAFTDGGLVLPVLLAVAGAGFVVTEVLVLTLLQRHAPADQRARLFGILDSLLVGGLMVGTLAAAPLIDWFGLRGSLVILGAAVPASAALAVPLLLGGPAADAVPLAHLAPRVDLLGGLRVLRHATRVSLEALAAGADTREVPDGTVVIRQGEQPDDFYAVEHGSLTVTIVGADDRGNGDGEIVAELGPGDGFGELGLLHGVPRQATVTASSDTTLVRIPGELFMRVVGPGRVTGGGTGLAGSLRDLWAVG